MPLTTRLNANSTKGHVGGTSLIGAGAGLAITLGIGLLLLQVAGGLSNEGDSASALLGFTFLSTLVAVYLTSISRKIQVCFQVTYIYFAVYLLLPGYNHTSANLFPFYSMRYPEETRWTAALIACLFLTALTATHGVTALKPWRRMKAVISAEQLRPNTLGVVVCWVLLALATIILLVVAGPSAAFAPRLEQSVDGDSAATTLATGLPRAVAGCALAYAILQGRLMRHKSFAAAVVLAFLPLVAVVDFPLAIPRYILFGLLLFCAFALFDFNKRMPRVAITLLFFFGAIVAMPVADALSRGGKSLSEITVAETGARYFESGDFDGVQSINNVVILVEKKGYFHGKQLVSAMLFFVPRSLWPDKGRPTGQEAADAVGFKFSNLSMPLPGEIYADFGIPGVLISAVLIGYLFSRLDRWIFANWYRTPASRFVAGGFVAYAIIVLRGSLIAVIGAAAITTLFCLVALRLGNKPRHQSQV